MAARCWSHCRMAAYGAQNEASFSRYRRIGKGWTIEDRTGVVHALGTASDNRVADPDHPDRIRSWLVERSTDPFGNTISYRWQQDARVRLCRSIQYAAYELRFVYGTGQMSVWMGAQAFCAAAPAGHWCRVDSGPWPKRAAPQALDIDLQPGCVEPRVPAGRPSSSHRSAGRLTTRRTWCACRCSSRIRRSSRASTRSGIWSTKRVASSVVR